MSMQKEKTEVEILQHDINSTVMSIKAYTQLLLRKAKPAMDEATYEYIERLNTQIDVLIQLLAQQAAGSVRATLKA